MKYLSAHTRSLDRQFGLGLYREVSKFNYYFKDQAFGYRLSDSLNVTRILEAVESHTTVKWREQLLHPNLHPIDVTKFSV